MLNSETTTIECPDPRNPGEWIAVGYITKITSDDYKLCDYCGMLNELEAMKCEFCIAPLPTE